jgi:hypothetical protein
MGNVASKLSSLYLGTDHIENTPFPTVSLLLRTYSFPREPIYRAVAQKRPLFIRLSRSHCHLSQTSYWRDAQLSTTILSYHINVLSDHSKKR